MFKTRFKIRREGKVFTLFKKEWYNIFWQQLIYSADEDYIHDRLQIEIKRSFGKIPNSEYVIWSKG